MKYFIILNLQMVLGMAIAQTSGDSISLQPVQSRELLQVANAGNNIIALSKTRPKARHKIQLKEGHKVWVEVQDMNGKTRIKKCRIATIADHAITFKPYNKYYGEVTYADSALAVIGFTTTGRIILASVVNTVVVGAGIGATVVVVVVIAIQAALFPILIFTRNIMDTYSFRWVGEAFEDIGLLFKMTLPFVRKIKFPNKKWQLKIVKEVDYLAQAQQ